MFVYVSVYGCGYVHLSIYLSRFTPNNEVDLCGHATLAAAHALYTTQCVAPGVIIRFDTLHSGELTAQQIPPKQQTQSPQAPQLLGNNGQIELNFPVTMPIAITLSPQELKQLLTALGLKSLGDVNFIGKTVFDYFVEVPYHVFACIQRTIDFNSVATLGGRGLILTCMGKRHTDVLLKSNPLDVSVSVSSSAVLDPRIENESTDFLSRFFAPWYVVSL